MGGQTLARGAHSRVRAHGPPRASTSARDHSLSAAAARVLRFEASSSNSSTYLWNKLLGLFSRRGGPPGLASRLFDALPEQDAVSYNTLIACLSRSAAADRARVYSRMLREDGGGVRPNGFTLSALLALPARGVVAASHGFVRQVRLGFCSKAFVGALWYACTSGLVTRAPLLACLRRSPSWTSFAETS